MDTTIDASAVRAELGRSINGWGPPFDRLRVNGVKLIGRKVMSNQLWAP
jgi:hypothetical protein